MSDRTSYQGRKFQLTVRQATALELMGGPRHFMLEGGSRSGKTFLICRAIAIRAMKAPNSRHLIARKHFNHVKTSIWHQTWPIMMRMCFPDVAYKMNKQDWFIEFSNGAQVWIGGLDEGERTEKILGNEYATIYANECSQIAWASIEILMTRLAQVCDEVYHDRETGEEIERKPLEQRFYFDCNPPLKSHWAYKLFHLKQTPEPPFGPIDEPEDYGWFRINPKDNEANLDPKFLKSIERLPTRARLRFWAGEWGSDTENALWTEELIERSRVKNHPDLQRVIVAVDPSGTKGPQEDKRSDHVGIVVVGLGVDGIAYVLEDLTCQVRPLVWGRIVVEAYMRHEADLIVGETNFGGAMVEDTVRAAASSLKVGIAYHEVTASRGKVVRAEPISTLYGVYDPLNHENDVESKVRHVGSFPELENQMCNFTSAGYMGERSPDRADALIWALTKLFPGMTRRVPRQSGTVTVEGVSGYSPGR